MGAILFRTVLIAVLISLAALIGKRVRRYHAYRALQRRTGCERAPCYPHTDPVLGLDLYRRRQRARDHGYNMALYMEDTRRLGHTWEENNAGHRTINVMDSVNYRYVHSEATEDFQRLVSRPSNAAVLGSGIYLAEGERWKHSRNLINPVFAGAGLGNMAILVRHVDYFMEHVPRDGRAFDIQPLLKRLVSYKLDKSSPAEWKRSRRLGADLFPCRLLTSRPSSYLESPSEPSRPSQRQPSSYRTLTGFYLGGTSAVRQI